MSGIKIKGFKEFQKNLDEMIQGLDPKMIQYFCDIIKKDAIITCRINEEDIILNVNSINNNDLKIEFQLKNKEKIQCFEKVFRNVLSTLPITSRSILEIILKKIEISKQESDIK